MIDGKRVVAVITARGGSKGVPGKNIRPVGGKPLLAWTIDAARASRHVDRVLLSTDDDRIAEVARECGCDVPFKRPAHLATDEAPSIDVVLHALDQAPEFDIVVLLQPTSPLRTAEDIDNALRCKVDRKAPACVSVVEVEETPYWMVRLDDTGHMHPLLTDPNGATRRQDLPKVHTLNGAVYVADCTWLRESRSFETPETVAYVMPRSRSIDIDTEDDFANLERRVPS